MMLDPLDELARLPGSAGDASRQQLGVSPPAEDSLPDAAPSAPPAPPPTPPATPDYGLRRRSSRVTAGDFSNGLLPGGASVLGAAPSAPVDDAFSRLATGQPPGPATLPPPVTAATTPPELDTASPQGLPAPGGADSEVSPTSPPDRAGQARGLAYGAGRGAAFLTGAPAGAGIGAEIGTVFGPVGAAAGGIIGGLVTGGAAAWGADKLARTVANHSDTVKSFTTAADEHPLAAGAGELVAGAAGLPRAGLRAVAGGVRSLASAGESGGNLARAGGAVAQGYEAAGGGAVETVANLTREAREAAARGESVGRIASPIAARVGAAAGGAAVLDTALKTASYWAGYSDGGQTLGGAAQAALLGAFAAGHGLRYPEYTPAAVGDVLLRAKVREEMGLPLTTGHLCEGYLPGERGMAPARAADLRRPLTEQEAGLYAHAREGLAEAMAGDSAPTPGGPARVQGQPAVLLPALLARARADEAVRRRREELAAAADEEEAQSPAPGR